MINSPTCYIILSSSFFWHDNAKGVQCMHEWPEFFYEDELNLKALWKRLTTCSSILFNEIFMIAIDSYGKIFEGRLNAKSDDNTILCLFPLIPSEGIQIWNQKIENWIAKFKIF